MGLPVVIVEHNPDWPAHYAEAKRELLDAVGDRLAGIEHIGSTAVPGLAAKPIIDIMAAVRDLADAPALYEPLARLGYHYAPEFEAVIPERRFFRKGPDHAWTHHLHLVELNSEFWDVHLLFRDYLIAHPDTAAEYERVKRELAAAYAADRPKYTEAKTPFIRSVEDRARAERDRQRHRV